MPSFLRGLFETKSAPKNAIPRAVSTARGYSGTSPGAQSWDTDQAIMQGYERVIWVYRCIDAIASNGSAIPMLVKQYDEDGKVVEDPDLLKLLNRRSNIYETSQQFRYRLLSQLLLSRRGAFIEVVRNRAGRPSELHLLPPGSTTPIADPKTYVSGYQVQTIQQGLVELEPDRVLWVRAKPHPTDVYAQMTPLVAAGLAADTDFLARLYNRNFLLNDGRPGMLVAIKGQIGDEDADEIERRFSGGSSNAGRTTVIEADGLDVSDMASSPRDVQWQEAVAGSKEDIMLAFGVPESVLGNASGRTYDNADAEYEIFWSATMMPVLDAVGAGLDILTPGGLEDDLIVAHDYATVDVLQRQKRAKQDRAMGEVKAGTMTIDEYLEVVGRAPIGVPGTEVFWMQQGLVPIGKDDEVTKAAAALMPVGQAQQGDPAAAAQQGAQQGVAAFQQSVENDNAARALRLAGKQRDPFVLETKEHYAVVPPDDPPHPYEAERTAVEIEIGAYVSAWSRRQERVILERLGGTKARKHTRHWEGAQMGTKGLNAQYIVSPGEWADALVEDMRDLFQKLAEQEALKAARELQRAGIVDKVVEGRGGTTRGRTPLDRLLGPDEIRSDLYSPVEGVEDWVRESALRQSERVADRIAEMDKAGASMDEIKKEVSQMVNSRSSWRQGLSVAAATSAMEGVRNEVYKRGGKYVKRVWRTMRDERVRPAHRRANGQRRAAQNPFMVGGVHMMYPGDPTAPIHLTANCRCWVEPLLSGKPISTEPRKGVPRARRVRTTKPLTVADDTEQRLRRVAA